MLWRRKSSLVIKNKNAVLLQTANSYVTDVKESKHILTKTLCDPASQQSYVTESVVNKLGLLPVRTINVNIKAFGDTKSQVKNLKEYQVVVVKPYGKETSVYINVLAVPNICTNINNQLINDAVTNHPFLSSLKLADDGSYPNLPIGLLVGSDYYWKIVDGNIRKDDNSGLVALNSAFGWLLSGPVRINDEVKNDSSVNTIITSHVMKIEANISADDKLSHEINRFWSLDEIGIAPDENSVYQKFKEEIDFRQGRYVVKLPLKEYRPIIPENKDLSKKRLIKQTERLKKDKHLLKKYDDVFRDQLSNGIIEEVQTGDYGIKGMTTYIPHQPVINEKKGMSKFRVVLDCSAKGKDGVSLNDVLYKGPLMLNKLFDLLIKFRLHNVALTADIKKAYLMIEVHETHRDLLRCIWWDDVFKEDPQMKIFRFRRVVFGAAPSQFLLNATLNTHAKKYDKLDSEFSRKVRKHLYSDDLCSGAKDWQSGYEAFKKFRIRFMEASFDISRWRTNDPRLRSLIIQNDEENGPQRKILGIK